MPAGRELPLRALGSSRASHPRPLLAQVPPKPAGRGTPRRVGCSPARNPPQGLTGHPSGRELALCILRCRQPPSTASFSRGVNFEKATGWEARKAEPVLWALGAGGERGRRGGERGSGGGGRGREPFL